MIRYQYIYIKFYLIFIKNNLILLHTLWLFSIVIKNYGRMDKLILDMLHQNIQFPDKKDLNFIVYTGHKKMKLTLVPIRNNHKLKE